MRGGSTECGVDEWLTGRIDWSGRSGEKQPLCCPYIPGMYAHPLRVA